MICRDLLQHLDISLGRSRCRRLGTSQERVASDRAIDWLRALSATWTEADVPEAKADVLHAIYDQIVVSGRRIVPVRLTPSAYAHGLALALPTKVALARPTGVERADAITIRIPIEGAGGQTVGQIA